MGTTQLKRKDNSEQIDIFFILNGLKLMYIGVTFQFGLEFRAAQELCKHGLGPIM